MSSTTFKHDSCYLLSDSCISGAVPVHISAIKQSTEAVDREP